MYDFLYFLFLNLRFIELIFLDGVRIWIVMVFFLFMRCEFCLKLVGSMTMLFCLKYTTFLILFEFMLENVYLFVLMFVKYEVILLICVWLLWLLMMSWIFYVFGCLSLNFVSYVSSAWLLIFEVTMYFLLGEYKLILIMLLFVDFKFLNLFVVCMVSVEIWLYFMFWSALLNNMYFRGLVVVEIIVRIFG